MSALAPARPAPRRAGTRAPALDLTGTGHLLRFALRRDRVRLAVWTGSLVALHAYFVTALSALYTTPAERQSRAALMESPVSTMMAGPGYGLEDYTVGAMLANELVGWVAIALALLNVTQVVRGTRGEEESGRADLVRAGVVGRHAQAAAAFCAVLLADVAIGLLSALVMVAGGLAVPDSLALGVATVLLGAVFAAVGVVVAQVTQHARGAVGLGVAVLAAAFLARAFGDVQRTHGSWLSWTSPIGWAQQTRAFVDLRWWPLLLHVALAVALLVLGAWLAGRRDVGAGLLAPRPGRAAAVPSLRSPAALAWRQQRTALVWWSAGLGLVWLATGTYLEGVEDMVRELSATNPQVLELFGGRDELVAGFLAVMVRFGVLLAAGYGIAAVLRARGEESSGRLEPVLALPVSRTRWLAAQVGVAALGTGVLVLVTGLTLWLGAVLVGVTDPGPGTYLVAVLAHVPALAVHLGLTAALYAWVPRAAAAVPWALLAFAAVVGVFGPLLDVPAAVAALDPFDAAPRVPLEDVTAAPLLATAAVAAALWALAFAGFRRRDLPAV
ncbi:ABC transporter permease [Kineococcus sp. SYSU DK004]|uniref:ABC transporter permease n=1 Tax=Kineococcus sp. SYSU DK004 TaxID=3383125 RepID=UPI003D7E557F